MSKHLMEDAADFMNDLEAMKDLRKRIQSDVKKEANRKELSGLFEVFPNGMYSYFNYYFYYFFKELLISLLVSLLLLKLYFIQCFFYYLLSNWFPKFATGLMSVLRPLFIFFLPIKYMNIFHKTEIQTVILRYWMGILIGSKVMTQMQNKAKRKKLWKTENNSH